MYVYVCVGMWVGVGGGCVGVCGKVCSASLLMVNIMQLDMLAPRCPAFLFLLYSVLPTPCPAYSLS